MDIQFFLMIVLFICAVWYVGRIVYRSIAPKNDGCTSGCGKCAANFDNIPQPKK